MQYKFLRRIKGKNQDHYNLFAKNGETIQSTEPYSNPTRSVYDVVDAMIGAIGERLDDPKIRKNLFDMLTRHGYTVVKDPSIIIK